MLRHALVVAVAALLALDVSAQGALPELPGTSALPSAPRNPGLPGVDSRQCGTSKFSALCAVGRWSLFSAIDLRVGAAGFSGNYRLEQAANGDVHATYREDVRGQRRGGEAVLFGEEGIAFRTRDELPPPEAVIDYLFSTPIMMGKLTAVLLDQGVLGPPADVTRVQAVKADSATQFIRTEAPRVAALYGPPWSMTGTVKPAPDGQVAFTLNFRFRPVDARGALVPGRTDTIALSGTVSYAPKRPTLPDTFDLVGWKVMKRDAPVPGAATLGDARAALGP